MDIHEQELPTRHDDSGHTNKIFSDDETSRVWFKLPLEFELSIESKPVKIKKAKGDFRHTVSNHLVESILEKYIETD